MYLLSGVGAALCCQLQPAALQPPVLPDVRLGGVIQQAGVGRESLSSRRGLTLSEPHLLAWTSVS